MLLGRPGLALGSAIPSHSEYYGGVALIRPEPDADDAFFWDGVGEGQLLVRRCAGCGRTQHPPTPMCPACGSVTWHTTELSGRGTVLSWIASHHPNQPDAQPRIVVLVELEEGHRLVANLYDRDLHDAAPGDGINGLAVRSVFVDVDGVRLPGFVAAGDGG